MAQSAVVDLHAFDASVFRNASCVDVGLDIDVHRDDPDFAFHIVDKPCEKRRFSAARRRHNVNHERAFFSKRRAQFVRDLVVVGKNTFFDRNNFHFNPSRHFL